MGMWQSIVRIFSTRPKYDILRELLMADGKPYPGPNKLFIVRDNRNVEYVLKLMPGRPGGGYVEEFLKLQELKDDHILKFIESGRIGNESLFKLPNNCNRDDWVGGFALIVEYCTGGDLACLPDDVSMDERKQYARDAISTIKLIHSQKVIHRDIKPGNLFRRLDRNGRRVLVVEDFDDAKESPDISKTKTHTKVGTRGFKAPEIVTAGKSRYSWKADAYSLGMTLIYLFAPSSFNWLEWLKKKPGRNELDLPVHVPDEFKMHIWGMTLSSTQDRLTVKEISICLKRGNFGISNLNAFKQFLGGIWAVRSTLSQIQIELDRCKLSDISGWRTVYNGFHTPSERQMKVLIRRATKDLYLVKLALKNISLNYNLLGLGPLEARACAVWKHERTYLLELESRWEVVRNLIQE